MTAWLNVIKMYKIYKETNVKVVYKKIILLAIMLISFIASVYFGYCFLFQKNSDITDFSNRIISIASYKNIDISEVVKQYYIFLVLCSIFVICLCFLFHKHIISFIKKIIRYIIRIIDYLVNKYILLSICISLSCAIPVYIYLSNYSSLNTFFAIIISIVVFSVIFLIIKLLLKNFLKNNFRDSIDLVSAISIIELFICIYSFCINSIKFCLLSIIFCNFIIIAVYFLNKKCIFNWNINIFTLWLSSFLCEYISLSILLSVITAYGMLISLFLTIIVNGLILFFKSELFVFKIDKIKKFIFSLSIFCILLNLLIEVIYTFNSYNISKVYGIITVIITTLIAIILYKIFNRKSININDNILYLLVFLAVIITAYMRGIHPEFTLSLFEDANHGVSFSELYFFGEFPIIDSFDAHMLSRFVLMQIYQLINSDYLTTLTVPYSYIINILIFISLFYIFKEFIGSEKAFLVTLILPFADLLNISNFINYYWLGLFLAAFYLFWLKRINNKNTIIINLIFWIISAFSIFYMLDVGATFGISMILCAIIYFIKNKQYKKLCLFFITGIIVALMVVLLIGFIFNREQIDFKDWIIKFLNSASSNQNWAYGILFNNVKGLIYCIFTYLILPAITLAAVYISYKNNVIKNKISLLFMLLFAFFLNASRIIVRHNLTEGSNALFVFELIILIIVLLNVVKTHININKHRNYKITFTAILLIVPLLIFYPYIGFGNNIINRLNINLNNLSSSVNNTLSSNNKSELNNKQKATVNELKQFFNLTLNDNETYLDFTNNTELYALLGLNNPVYVNQSPGLVNGEKGQTEFIDELKGKNIPFALMPLKNVNLSYSLDGILNSDRYYLITEYICNNYTPLCKVNNYAVWCIKSRYSYYTDLIGNQYELLTDCFYCDNDYYIHNLGLIPYLWSNYDSPDSVLSDKTELKKINNSNYFINHSLINENEGNYLIFDITSNSDTNIDFTLFNNSNNIKKQILYNFSLIEGRNTYKLRISSDITWHLKLLDIIQIENNKDFLINSISICSGDIVNS